MSNRKFTPSKPHWIWLQNAIANHNSDDCLIWPFAIWARGYGYCYYDGKDVRAHRLGFFLSNGHWPTPQGRHTCDVPACVNPRHIIEGTALQNTHDMIERGRQKVGERHHQCKLTDSKVRQIREDYGYYTLQELAAEYGVSIATVSYIVRGETWKHLL